MTKAEATFQDAVRQLGCIACRRMGIAGVPCDVHHILRGGRRIGELDVIGLCPTHHRSGVNDGVIVSRHPWRKAFERTYGTEQELLAETRELVQVAA
jgi:hypothetical protein